jgi:SWI/SNF-related matrix-associated actin-dependent regulator of chromatin subfamily A3
MGEGTTLDAKLRAPDMRRNRRCYIFDIGRTPTHAVLYFGDGVQFAILNSQISKALSNILAVPTVNVEAFADIVEVGDTIRKSRKACEATLRVNVNVYGSLEIRTQVAALLSEHKVWLQHPQHQRAGSTYDNPHVITFPEVNSQNALPAPGAASQEDLLDDKDRFNQAISQVYASLKRDTRLQAVEADARLKTKLLT